MYRRAWCHYAPLFKSKIESLPSLNTVFFLVWFPMNNRADVHLLSLKELVCWALNLILWACIEVPLLCYAFVGWGPCIEVPFCCRIEDHVLRFPFYVMRFFSTVHHKTVQQKTLRPKQCGKGIEFFPKLYDAPRVSSAVGGSCWVSASEGHLARPWTNAYSCVTVFKF